MLFTMEGRYARRAAALILLSACLTRAHAQHTPATREFFYVGGRYVGDSTRVVMTNQMYVEVLRPSKITQRLPLVLIHGNWQTATRGEMERGGVVLYTDDDHLTASFSRSLALVLGERLDAALQH